MSQSLEIEYENLWHELQAIDPKSFCDISLYTGDRTLFVNHFFVGVESRGKGFFKTMLDMVCSFADKHGANISLQPEATEKQSDLDRLKKTYQSYGFEHNPIFEDFYTMTRKPNEQHN
jgi:GNAT superfamily N-acetyltransferase